MHRWMGRESYPKYVMYVVMCIYVYIWVNVLILNIPIYIYTNTNIRSLYYIYI